MAELVTSGSPTESQAQPGPRSVSPAYRPRLQWRERAYWLTLALMALIAVAAPQTSWFLTANSHMVLEVISTTVALLVGCLALARHFSRRSGRFFFIGVGFLGTAFFDATHTV
ncbi:MAG TPA: hypothetical protein VNK95_11495, partial [Caldilineaceae bacterium]|nr:hypothetical protein [Caldilineaceae bacterium]